jgi:hypothetical protein
LVRLGPPERNQQTFFLKFNVSHIECHQLRTSKCSSEADQQQCSISYSLQSIGQQAKHDTEIFDQDWRLLICSSSVRPLDALEGLGYEYVIRYRRGEACGFVRFADGRQMMFERRRSESPSLRAQVERNRFSLRRQR